MLTQKYFGGVVPPRHELQPIDEEVLQQLREIPDRVASAIETYNFREATAHMMDLARTGNKYLADTEPWKAIKESKERVETILNIGLQITASLSVIGYPFLPFTSEKLQAMLKFQSTEWKKAGDSDLLTAGHTLEKPALLFQKVEDEWVEQQVAKLHQDDTATKEEPTTNLLPMKEEITYDDFVKLDMRVATILTAEKVKKSKKLLKMTLDTGLDQRTVLSGIAQHYEPEAIVGKQVCVLVNLAPRKMMGIESQGMILMAEDTDGKLLFMQPEGETSNGSGIS